MIPEVEMIWALIPAAGTCPILCAALDNRFGLVPARILGRGRYACMLLLGLDRSWGCSPILWIPPPSAAYSGQRCLSLAVLETIFDAHPPAPLPPLPREVQGEGPAFIFLRKSMVLGRFRFRPGSGGQYICDLISLAPSTGRFASTHVS